MRRKEDSMRVIMLALKWMFIAMLAIWIYLNVDLCIIIMSSGISLIILISVILGRWLTKKGHNLIK